jgi:hypothetical protein
MVREHAQLLAPALDIAHEQIRVDHLVYGVGREEFDRCGVEPAAAPGELEEGAAGVAAVEAHAGLHGLRRAAIAAAPVILARAAFVFTHQR